MKLTKPQKQQLNKIGKKFGLFLVLLFGSKVSGKTSNPESDLDIAVLDSKPETYQRFRALFQVFSQAFKGHNVDLRFIKDSEPVFFYQTFKNSQLLYGSHEDYYSYKAYAYKNYIDSQFLFKLKDKLIYKRQKVLNQLVR